MKFSFIHITDHHLAESEEMLIQGFSPAYALRKVLQHIAQNNEAHPDFIVSTGDLVDSASERSYETFRHILNMNTETTQIPGPTFISTEGLQNLPFYCFPGNHDDRDAFFRSFFPKSTPEKLMNTSFIWNGVQFIFLDWGPESKASTHPETIDFLKKSLQNGAPSIILMHYQVTTIGSRWLDALLSDKVELFWQTVSGKNILGIFCGHIHTTYERVVDNIPVFGLRSTAFPFVLQDEPLACLLPPHYRLVTIENNILTTKVYEVKL